MAILNFCGFETGDFNEANTTVGTLSVQSSVKRTGGYALQVNPTTTNTGFYALSALNANGAQNASLNTADLYTTLYFRYATKPASNSEILLEIRATAAKLTVRINSTGNLILADSGGVLGTGSTALSQDTWYRLDVRAGTDATTAPYELKIDGTTELSGNSSNMTTNAASIRIGKSSNLNGQSVDFFYDDVIVSDSAYVGAFEVVRLAPDGNGNYTDWTGTYTDVDDVPHDTNTTYINSSTSGQAETVTLDSTTTAGISGTIHSVKAWGLCRDEGGSSAFQLRLRSGSTDVDTTSRDPGATYAGFASIHNTDPNTSSAWTTGGVDGVEVGVEANANVAHRCTALCAMVAYTPGGGGGGGGTTFHGHRRLPRMRSLLRM